MSEEVSVDIVRRVFDDSEGVWLEVGPSAINPEKLLSLCAEGEKNVEWWGRLDISFTPEFAVALGKALVAAGEEMKAGK